MEIEVDCPHCKRRLTTPAEYAGKTVSCPACDKTFTMQPRPAENAAQTTGEVEVASLADLQAQDGNTPTEPPPKPATPILDYTPWFLRVPEGWTYGPVPRLTLNAWVREGRVAANCEVRPNDATDWQAADMVFSALRVVQPASPATAPIQLPPIVPVEPAPQPAAEFPLAKPVPTTPDASSYILPHRGPVVLTLGLLGLVAWCPIFSILAWIIGTADLREMGLGKRDQAGAGLTQAGRMMGIILSLLWVVVLVISIFMAMIGRATNLW